MLFLLRDIREPLLPDIADPLVDETLDDLETDREGEDDMIRNEEQEIKQK